MYTSFTLDNKATCDICHIAKQRKLSYTPSNSISSSSFELLHMDIWGQITIPSTQNHQYFLTMLEDHTRFLWIILLRNKYEVSQHVQNFIHVISNQFNTIPKFIRSHNGPEFMISQFYASKGVAHQKSCVENL